MTNYVQFDTALASRRVKAMMERAARIAAASEMRHKHGAVVTVGGSVVSVGLNIFRNVPSPHIPYDFLSTHAEINALSGITRHASATLYVARVNKNGDLMPSEPCHHCKNYIAMWRPEMKRVIFS